MKKYYALILTDFSWLVLSALGFSFSLAIIRIYGNSDILREALNLQSYVIVISFLSQLGARALVRRLVYANLKRLTHVLECYTSIVHLALSPVGFLIGYAFELEYFWCLSILLSLNTFYLTGSVAKKRHDLIAFYSVTNFIVAAFGGTTFLLIGYENQDYAYSIIEFTALAATVILFLSKKPKMLGGGFKKYLLLIKSAQSYQLGSVNIILMVFFVMQGSITVFSEPDYLDSYADLQIISGAFSLIAGKLLLVLERKLYLFAVSRILYFVFVLFFTLLVSFLSAVILHLDRGVSFFVFIIISWVLFSKISIGYVVQYVSNRRRLLDVASVCSLVYFVLAWFFIQKENWQFVSFFYSVSFLLVGGVLLMKRKAPA